MKQPKDKIHKLIHSMSPAEKRYFKRHYAPKQNNLTILFDFVNTLDEYDEDFVKKQFENSKIAKNLKVYKVQLLNLILKSLTSYHSKNNPKSQIRSGLEEVDVLIDKQLYTYAADHLARIKKVCIQYEEYSYLVEIFYKEYRLNFVQHDSIRLTENPIFDEVQKNLQLLEDQINFTLLGAEIMDYRKQKNSNIPSNEDGSLVEQVLNDRMMKLDVSSLPFRAQLSRNIILGNIYFLQEDAAAEANAKANNVALFHQHEHFKTYLGFEYLAVLVNYFNLTLEQENYQEVFRIYEQAKLFVEENSIFKSQLVYFFYGYLKANFDQGNFSANIGDTEHSIVKLLEEHDIGQERIALLIYTYLTLTHIALEAPQKVQLYIRNILQCRPEAKGYFEEIINLIELIHHYETKDEVSLKRRLGSIFRKKEKQPAWEPFYEDMLSFLQNLTKSSTNSVATAQSFYENLEQYEGQKTYFLFKYFKLQYWLKAIVNGYAFANELRSAL